MPFRCPDWPPSWPEIEESVLAAVRSGQWGRYRSEMAENLQTQLAQRFQSRHVRLCCSGSAAIETALRAAGVGSGDEVIVSAYDYPGNLRGVELVGARPVLVDVARDSFGIDPHDLARAAGEKVRAVISSHLFGVATEMAALRQGCDDRGWVLIEDACQVPGMRIGEKPAGSFGHFAALSFGGSKPLSAGSGGALLTSDLRLSARLGPLLDRPSDVIPLSSLQAAVLLPQMERLQELCQQRTETVSFLETEVSDRLQDWRWLSPLSSGVAPSHYKIAWQAKSAPHRRRIVEQASRLGLPIGEGFRDHSRCSQRRCRKPVSLPRSTELGETVFVLDHSALLIESSQHSELAQYLTELHDRTR